MDECNIDQSIELLSQIPFSDSDFLKLIDYTQNFIINIKITPRTIALRDD